MRTSRILIIGAFAAAAAAGAYAYVRHAERYPSTDDAYLDADVVHVAAQVPGPVIDVATSNQAHVRKGDLLFAVDPQPYRLAVQEAEAQLALARQQVAEDAAAVDSAQADLHNREVLLQNARLKLQRSHQLARKAYLSKQSADDAEAAYRSAEAMVNLAQAQLNEARKRLGTAGERNQRVRQAQAALGRAQWNLDHARVQAACNGHIAQLTLQRGDTVSVGAPLFVLVCDDTYTVTANYKETEIAKIHPDQPVDVTVDMYPGVHFKGKVESINPASGVAFSLLPPQNATGNWVKVTQRVPVKIRLLDPGHAHPLRVGTSAVVTIDTTAHPDQDQTANRIRE
ncbi:MAG: HlyD family secretion protein [Gammaproteobacteria bacterium]